MRALRCGRPSLGAGNGQEGEDHSPRELGGVRDGDPSAELPGGLGPSKERAEELPEGIEENRARSGDRGRLTRDIRCEQEGELEVLAHVCESLDDAFDDSIPERVVPTDVHPASDSRDFRVSTPRMTASRPPSK